MNVPSWDPVGKQYTCNSNTVVQTVGTYTVNLDGGTVGTFNVTAGIVNKPSWFASFSHSITHT